MEKIIHKHMFNFFKDHEVITCLQSGFVSEDSTVNQLLQFQVLRGHHCLAIYFLILFQNEKQNIEMSVDIHRLINSIFYD